MKTPSSITPAAGDLFFVQTLKMTPASTQARREGFFSLSPKKDVTLRGT